MTKRIITTILLIVMAIGANAQVKEQVDTLQCNIIGFGVGTLMPVSGSSSGGLEGGTMMDLYKGPSINFALEWGYKFLDGWMLSTDADLWFGYNSDNLQDREARLGDLYTSQGYLMSWGGYDGSVTLYNRGIAVRPGIGKIINIMPKNPNSGILLKLSGGWFMQKTVHMQDMNESLVPQLNDKYMKLYDHLRNGVILTQSVGFIFMSNYQTYINFKVMLDISECVSWSSRPYVIDNLMGLHGKDKNRYFDLIVGLKVSWMFPLTGRTSYDYYYY